MALATYLQKSLIDWSTRAATPTQPAACFAGLAGGAPSSISGSEISATGYVRQTCGFGAAVTTTGNVGSVTNATAFTFTFSTAIVVSGMQIWNTTGSSNGGTMLWFGNLSAVSSMVSGDTLAFAIGALHISLS